MDRPGQKKIIDKHLETKKAALQNLVKELANLQSVQPDSISHSELRDHFRQSAKPLGDHAVTHPVFWLSKTPAEMRRGALIGEHNEHAYKGFIGMAEEEYNAGVESGLIQ